MGDFGRRLCSNAPWLRGVARGLLGAALLFASPAAAAAPTHATEEKSRVVVYAFTSRIKQVEKAFEAQNPQFDVVAVDLASTKLMARLIAEQQAGCFAVDVVYVGDAPVVLERLWRENRVETYIPAGLDAMLSPRDREPLLVHRLSTKVVMYNAALHPDGPPLDNLWDLTSAAFKRRVVFVDPTQRGDYLDFFTEIFVRRQEMESAYEAYFGAPFPPQPDGAGAGEVFIRALMANEPIVVASTTAVNRAVGGALARRSFVGIGTYSDVRDNRAQGWALQIASTLQPSAGIVYPIYLAPARHAPNPEGAHALIDFMLGDASRNGGPGFRPFWMPGEYPTRVDIALHPETIPLDRLSIWRTDPARIAETRARVLDLLLSLM
jgi:iron(III) transport system substrate-binding protein